MSTAGLRRPGDWQVGQRCRAVAALLVGAGLGASRVTALISRYGHQQAFAAVYLVGAGACLLTTIAVATANFPL